MTGKGLITINFSCDPSGNPWVKIREELLSDPGVDHVYVHHYESGILVYVVLEVVTRNDALKWVSDLRQKYKKLSTTTEIVVEVK